MKHTIRSLLCVLALAVPAWALLFAADPADRVDGTVLVLDNGRSMEGEIQRQGDRYRVRRDAGELWVPADRVKWLCRDWDEVTRRLHTNVNLRDPDERLRLARWCEMNNQHDRALAEAREALRLRPGHAPTQKLVERVERLAKIASRPPAPVPLPADRLPPPSYDISAESVGVFMTRVQPVLMNTCARCHANNYSGEFQLQRTYGSGDLSRRSTQYNLAAVVAQVDVHRPGLSPLLIKAISKPHGGVLEAPIPGPDTTAYKILEGWVNETLRVNPHLKEMHVASARPAPEPEPVFTPSVRTVAADPPVFAASTPPSPTGGAPLPVPRQLPPLPDAQPLTAGVAPTAVAAQLPVPATPLPEPITVRPVSAAVPEGVPPVVRGVLPPTEAAQTAETTLNEYDAGEFNRKYSPGK